MIQTWGLLFVIMTGLLSARPHQEPALKKTEKETWFSWSKTFAELMHHVEEKYYEKPRIEEAMIRAMKGLVSLDPHSSFLDTKSFTEILQTTNGSFSGIGIVLDPSRTQGPFKIISVLPQNPAEKAGIKGGDFIIAIDNQSTLDLPYETLIEKLRGPQATTVTLTVLRGTKLKTITVTRDVIKDETHTCFVIGENEPTLYVSLKQFTSQCSEICAHTQKMLEDKNIKKLVIDLRDNGGGLLTAALEAASYFLPAKTPVVVTLNQQNAITQTYATSSAPTYPHDLMIVLLVNHLTASAAEILAGTLSYYVRQGAHLPWIITIGEQTFGKGSVQEVIPLSNDCAVKLTTALYALPDKTIIQNLGITPDIVVTKLATPSDHEVTMKRLLSSEKHLAGALTQDTITPQKQETSMTLEEKRIKHLKQDNQLTYALNALAVWEQAQKQDHLKTMNSAQAVSWLKQQLPTQDTSFTPCDLSL